MLLTLYDTVMPCFESVTELSKDINVVLSDMVYVKESISVVSIAKRGTF